MKQKQPTDKEINVASVIDLAHCSNAVYSNVPEVGGWETRKVYNPTNTGFFAALFVRVVSSKLEAILAFRGTDDPSSDLLSDTQLALGILPGQSTHAKKALIDALRVAEVPATQLILTGHSLGGGLAALKSARHTPHLPVVTFNAPGMYRASVVAAHGEPRVLKMHGSLREYRSPFNKVLHIRSEYDIVSIGTGPSIMGATKTLENNQCGAISFLDRLSPQRLAISAARRAICAHKMTVLLDLIKSQKALGEPVEWS